MKRTSVRLLMAALILAPVTLAVLPAAQAASILTPESQFAAQGGPALYGSICAGCHMPGAQGAVGAGHYPALAGNPHVASAGYVVHNVLHGYHGMPGFGGELSDQQVADVVNYVRTHFGNAYADAVSPDMVAKAR